MRGSWKENGLRVAASCVLLASVLYCGTYLGIRPHGAGGTVRLDISIPLHAIQASDYLRLRSCGNVVFWPLREIDSAVTGREIDFVYRPKSGFNFNIGYSF